MTATEARAARTTGRPEASRTAVPDWLSRAAFAGLAVASGLAGSLAGCRPTGTPGVDPVLSGLLAALMAASGAWASRGAMLAAGVAAVAMSRGWLWLPSGGGLAIALGHAVRQERHPLAGVLTCSLLVQVLLRWPSAGFTGLPSAVAAAVTLMLTVSALRALPRRPRRGILGLGALVLLGAGAVSAVVAASLLEARGPLDAGVTKARSALAELQAGHTEVALADLSTASADLARARARASAWWDVPGSAVPVLSQQRRAVVGVTGAGDQLVTTALAAARALRTHPLGAGTGGVDLGSVRALAWPVRDLAASLARTEAVVEASRSPWLVAPIGDRLRAVQAQLRRDVSTANLAAQGIQAAPGMLGGAGPKRYFVAFTTPAEDRGLGGFIGAYAVITVDRGRFTLTRSGRAPLLAPPPGAVPALRAPLDYLDRYGAFQPQAHFQDLTYSPDFPTVGRVIAGLYPQMQGGQPLDGAVALDPYALQALLRFTGPIAVTGLGRPLTSANAADVLLRQQYLADVSPSADGSRHDLLQEALSTGFERFTADPLPPPGSLTRALDPLVRQGRLMFWAAEPRVQGLLHRAGLDGSFPRPAPGSDVLAVTLANYDNNKIDAYLHESLTDAIHYNPRTGDTRARMAVILRNGAPAASLPEYVVGSFPGSGVPRGTDREWVTLYTPFTVTSSTLGGQPFQLGNPLPELGVLAYSGYVEVPAGGTVQLDVSLAGRLPPGPAYRLALRLQPLANPVHAQVTLTGGRGWGPPVSWVPGADSVQDRTWRFSRTSARSR